MPGPVFLCGDDVTLHPVEADDYEFIQRNGNHPAVRPGFGGGRPATTDDVAERIENMQDDDNSETFLVCVEGAADTASSGDDSPTRVGEVFLFDLYEGRGSVELGYWIAPEHHGNGYATAAAALAVDYCFTERRLHKVNARVLAFNDGSRAVLEKVGFEPEGCRSEEFYLDGEYVDSDLYGLVADDWAGLDAVLDGEGGGD